MSNRGRGFAGDSRAKGIGGGGTVGRWGFYAREWGFLITLTAGGGLGIFPRCRNFSGNLPSCGL